VTIRADQAGQVDCRASISLKLSARAVWGELRDFRRYASHDYFHRDVRIAGGVARAGAALRLLHCFAGFRVERIGRICLWREGQGFAFSDLSAKGPHVGFPHILSLHVEPTGEHSSIVHLRVRGRWTATCVPRILRKIWLAWVFGYIVTCTQNDLLAYQLARAKLRLRAIAC
jgi:hypothetical protein